jgi:hypothetical protein
MATRTALDLIKRAYRLIGVYAIGETPSADESQDALAALNAMLGEWANEKLMLYAASLDSITLTPSVGSYTIGPTGTTVSPRPESIDPSTYLDLNGVSYPLDVVTLDQYNSLPVKTLTSNLPEFIWFNPTFPNATLTLYPTPSSAATLKLWSWKPLMEFATLTDVLTLPPGYENAITFNLAEALAPENEIQVPASVHMKAVTSKKKLKRTNFTPQFLEFPASVVPHNGRFNIYTGLPL